ncbi:MAG: GNAT family N-acetyltransferase [Anaerolineales bacterium]|jgi:RimJ/RimL family protein N-acetyltransferase
MPEIEIRPAIATDIPHLMALEHDYTSNYVWQMELHEENEQISVLFRETRLPRSVQVVYPRNPQKLADEWTNRSVMLVAVLDDETIGYIGLIQNMTPLTTWVIDLVVGRKLRRQGIASALLLAAQEWASDHQSRRLIIEIQPKNHAAIRLAQKLGFDFCGYNDHFFANHDIALFFDKWLR